MKEPFIESCIILEKSIPLKKYYNWLSFLEFTKGLIEIGGEDTTSNFDTDFFYKRNTIFSETKNPKSIQKSRLNNELIIFNCSNPELTKWAAQDQRIDGVQFHFSNIHKLADDSTINLLKLNEKCIDINLMDIINKKYSIGPLRNIKKVVHRAFKKKIPILISSYAKYPEDLRSRNSIIGFSHFIGMPELYYLNVCQKWLYLRLVRNSNRLKKDFVSPDIWITK